MPCSPAPKHTRHSTHKDEEGRSPLHWAVDGGHAALVECLLGRGADVGLKDSQGDTALDYAELCEYEEIAAVLVRLSGLVVVVGCAWVDWLMCTCTPKQRQAMRERG